MRSLAAATYGEQDPLAEPVGAGPMTVQRTESGALLRIELPFAQRQDVDLARHADELVVTVGSYRRMLALPAALAHLDVAGARVHDGGLQVRFTHEDAPRGGTEEGQP